MPELPEVESARRILHTALQGRVVHFDAVEQGGGPRAGQFDEKIFHPHSASQFHDAVNQKYTVAGTGRHGKWLWVHLAGGSVAGNRPGLAAPSAALPTHPAIPVPVPDNARAPPSEHYRAGDESPCAGTAASPGSAPTGSLPTGRPAHVFLMLHLGMSGSIISKRASGELCAVHYRRELAQGLPAWPPKYCKLLMHAPGVQVAFSCPRRFGKCRLVSRPQEVLHGMGWDAQHQLPTAPLLHAQLHNKPGPIKAVLLDQSFCAGIGNWIADEVLYDARIHPQHPANALGDVQAQRLHHSISRVVGQACDVGADYDRFDRDMLFHYRWTKRAAGSKDAHGHAIKFIDVGGRTTAYVPHVQGGKVWAHAKGGSVAGSGARPAAPQTPGPMLKPAAVHNTTARGQDRARPMAAAAGQTPVGAKRRRNPERKARPARAT